MRRLPLLCLAALALVGANARAESLPRPDHIVIVIEENHGYAQIIGNPDAPWINALAKRGMLFTQSFGVTHPSQPNYLALFSGSTQGVGDDGCPVTLAGPNLASALQARGLAYASYSEGLPEAGSTICAADGYRRKHNPAANWPELAATLLPFAAFPAEFSRLPAVSLVVPDQSNDMHDGSIARGDAWLKANIEAYARWADAHNSLLIVTWDEDDGSGDNRIATIFAGAMVKRGSTPQRIDHYSVLRTLEEMYGLGHAGESERARPIAGVWRKAMRVKR
jgi:phosphatidylinositol-3-phosphatase